MSVHEGGETHDVTDDGVPEPEATSEDTGVPVLLVLDERGPLRDHTPLKTVHLFARPSNFFFVDRGGQKSGDRPHGKKKR